MNIIIIIIIIIRMTIAIAALLRLQPAEGALAGHGGPIPRPPHNMICYTILYYTIL